MYPAIPAFFPKGNPLYQGDENEEEERKEDLLQEVMSDIGVAESSIHPKDSVLEFLVDLLGPDFFHHIALNAVLQNNPQFILTHLTEIPVTPDLIITVMQDPDLVQVLVRRYITPENKAVIEEFNVADRVDEDYATMIEMLEDEMPEFYASIKHQLSEYDEGDEIRGSISEDEEDEEDED